MNSNRLRFGAGLTCLANQPTVTPGGALTPKAQPSDRRHKGTQLNSLNMALEAGGFNAPNQDLATLTWFLPPTGLCRIIICGSQGDYLEAGRIRGEFAGYDWHNGRADGFVGDAARKARLKQATEKGLQTKKYALPPDVSAGGHGGSHGYLADDFIDAILRGRKPAVDVIDALNMTVPGCYAHLSATKEGENLKIPQYSL